MSRINLSGWMKLAVCALGLATACTQAPAATSTSTNVPTPDGTATAVAATAEAGQLAALQEAQVATGVAATLTAQPTATATATTVPSDTPTATHAPTKTPTNTPAASATPSRTAGPTQPPQTAVPTAAPTSASVYGFTSGAPGYFTDIRCSFSGGTCLPTMPAGDVSFDFILVSDVDTPLTLFEQYGLAVEKDGVNVANMFMFVDAGLLPPDTGVRFGASRNFTTPGRYVIRSSGCLTTVNAPCGWSTMTGTTVTFVIK